MFERICIAPEYPDPTHFDLGLLGEALVFYGEVVLILQYSSLQGLLQQCDPDTLLRYLQHGRLKIKYRQQLFGAISQGEGTPIARYDFGLVSSEQQELENAAYELFTETTGKSGRGRRLAARFLRFVDRISYDADITKRVVEEVQKGNYVEAYVSRLLNKNLHKDLRRDLKFRFEAVIRGQGFPLSTNINFARLNERQGSDEMLKKPSSILAQYGTAVADLSLWSKLDAEVAVNENQADILQARFDTLLTIGVILTIL